MQLDEETDHQMKMTGFMVFNNKTRKIIGICALIALLIFAFGIVIGFFSGKGSGKDEGYKTLTDALTASCSQDNLSGEGKNYFIR